MLVVVPVVKFSIRDGRARLRKDEEECFRSRHGLRSRQSDVANVQWVERMFGLIGIMLTKTEIDYRTEVGL